MAKQDPQRRRGRPRRPSPNAAPDDLYDYAAEPEPQARAPRRGASRRFDVESLPVYDDWPERVPVTEEEVDIFERYFGDVLDRLFGPIEPAPGNNGLPKLTFDVNNKS